MAGQRYGRLTTLTAMDERRRGGIVWECACDCGETILRSAKNLKNGDARSCGCLRREHFERRRAEALAKLNNPEAPPWALTSEGYIRTQIAGESILQHRYLMERHLGRKLEPHENVHHKNGDRADNRIENLEVWSKSQPAGQRAIDKLAWAREIVALYEPIEHLL